MIRQEKYNKINCTGCGEFTQADLVAFDFSKIFMEVVQEETVDPMWVMLGRLDLGFYYTIRDICQELHYSMNRRKPTKLRLTVKDVIEQIEFLLDDIVFDKLKNENRHSVLYNQLYEKIQSTYGTAEEEMDAIERLIRNLATSDKNLEILSVDIQIEMVTDEGGREMPTELFYYIHGEKRELKERVCPLCGMPMDSQAGYRNEYIIGLAGLARVGKTALIASLIHQLRQLEEMDYIHIKSEASESLQKFQDEVVAEYESGNIIRKTEVENVDNIPLVYVPVQIGSRECNFIFVDMPGEIYTGSEEAGLDFISNKRTIMKNADVVWCCVEPSMFDERFKNAHAEAKADDVSRQLSDLVRVLNMIYNTKIPASIVVTQSDIIKDAKLFRPQEDVMHEYLLEDHSLDWDKTKAFVEETRHFVDRLNNFKVSIEDTFEGLSMFGVASYGFDVTTKALITSQTIHPSMVELPFLWTLAVLDLIPVTRSSTAKSLLGKEKVITEKIGDTKELYLD